MQQAAQQAERNEIPPAPFMRPLSQPALVELPESRRYRLKSKLLGPPLDSAQLEHERLGIPTALAVFSSDCISSSAYATEEILRVLIPAVGVFAFSLVVPITTAMIVVLFFLVLSYRETIKEYPTAGGAYMVTRDNFGLLPAQVAGVSLLTDYVLTVAVSTAAGAAALTSAFAALRPWSLWISIGFVGLIALGNLRGVKESGKIFAVPTYVFIATMGALLATGLVKALTGGLHPQPATSLPGMIPVNGSALGAGLFYGASLYIVLHAFASGGAAVTGVEAISNGVTAFRRPEWKNARVALVIMGATLGTLFFGLSALSTRVHPVPYAEGSPTVIAQIGKQVFGPTPLGHGMFYLLQAGTMLILVLAANTSFADFPRLASFHAGDNFMPRQLTKRGHRLVFSNGIIALALAAIVLLLATDAKVDRLIPLYAIGVFTSFTMSQAGMAKHHVTRKEPGWRKGLFVNGTGAVLSLVVDLVILVTKFTHGAWVIVGAVPVMVVGLVRLNRQYESETVELANDAPRAATAPILRRHVVVVLVDVLDVAAARAIQYARTLTPDELRVVHVDVDPVRTDDLMAAWSRLGLTRLTLDVVACPDRRIARAAANVAAQILADGETELSVLVPHREYTHLWHRLLHDRTGQSIAAVLSSLPHCNVTFVPYHLGRVAPIRRIGASTAADVAAGADRARDGLLDPDSEASDAGGEEGDTAAGGGVGLDVGTGAGPAPGEATGVMAQTAPAARRGQITVVAPASARRLVGLPTDAVPLAELRERQQVQVAGRVHVVRVRSWATGVPAVEATLMDGTGSVLVVFLGRRKIAGLRPGVGMRVEGRVGRHRGQPAMLNPTYELLPA